MKKMFRMIFVAMALCLAMATPAVAAPVASDSSRTDTAATPRPPRISLLTADPGPEIFELYGHEAVRVQTPDGFDATYNFGLFDFNQPNFLYRFLKGRTDYMAGAFPTDIFLNEYEARGSAVTEQELNLHPDEAWRMAAMLSEAIQPGNDTYRYRYCTNNCATRVLDILEASLSSPVSYPDTDPSLDTYRKVMRRYNRNYPWYQAGIDVALGGGIDTAISARGRMFVPVELRKAAAGATLADGRPLVSSTRTLVAGRGDVTLPATPLLLTPRFWGWILLLFTLIAVYFAMRRGWRRWRWWPSLWWTMTGIAGCLSWFLIFISEHEATSPNILGWWLNPLWLIPAVTMWLPRLRRFTKYLLILLSLMAGGMLLAWNLFPQAVNTALFLMCATTLTISVSYLLTAPGGYRR